MKKIILIDDRTERQIKFYEETGINFDKDSDVLDNFTAHSYEKLLEEFRNNDFSRLDKYEVIITHRSAFGDINGQVISTFKEICKQKNKPKSLVFFSGGISSVSIKNSPFEHLLLNSKKFYSTNLKLFLELSKTNNPNLHVLAFGKNWEINLLLNSLEKINLEVGKNIEKEEIRWDGFKMKTKLGLISDFVNIEEPELVNNFVSIQNLKKLTIDITNQIKKQVVLNV